MGVTEKQMGTHPPYAQSAVAVQRGGMMGSGEGRGPRKGSKPADQSGNERHGMGPSTGGSGAPRWGNVQECSAGERTPPPRPSLSGTVREQNDRGIRDGGRRTGDRCYLPRAVNHVRLTWS